MNQRMNCPKMLGIIGDWNGPNLWRILQPITALQKVGAPCEWDFKTAPGVGALGPAFDGYILPRLAWPPAYRWMAQGWLQQVHASGRFVVFDADDDIFTAADTYRRVELGWTEGKTFDELEAERTQRIWALQQSDGVTVSTEPLAEVVRSFTTRPVIVVPNAIDLPWFRSVLRGAQRRTDGIAIGWAGGLRSSRDLAPVAEAWSRIAARFSAVRFVVQGHTDARLVGAVPADRLLVLPWMPLQTYPAGLVETDIACCAVTADRWNENKSEIKAYEAAAAGAAVVATPTVYGRLIEHGTTGYLAETADEWEHALAELVSRPALRSIMATRLLRVVERRCSLSENIWRWPSAWSAIQEDARSRRGRLVAV